MISEQLIKDLTNQHLEGTDRFAVSVAEGPITASGFLSIAIAMY